MSSLFVFQNGLIGGSSGGGSGGGSVTVPDASTTTKGIVQLSNDINSTSEILAATPKAVSDALASAIAYVDSKIQATTLTKEYYIIPATTNGQTEIVIPNPDYNPTEYLELLFRNTTKVMENAYTITAVSPTEPTQGYKIVLGTPVVDSSNTIFNLVLIKGGAGGSSGGSVIWNDF